MNMPSDAKKREQQRKKDAAKARQSGKKQPKAEEQSNPTPVTTNGTENGTVQLSEEGNWTNIIRKLLLITC